MSSESLCDRPVSPLYITNELTEDYLIHFEDNCERFEEIHSDDDVEANVPLETVGRNAFGAKKEAAESKYKLKTMLSSSSKYMQTFEEFSDGADKIRGLDLGQRYEKKIDLTTDTERLSKLMKQYLTAECDFSVSVPESVKRHVEQINYLPKISCHTPNPSVNNEPGTSGSEKPKSCALSKLSGWNQLDDMNKKCSKWLEKRDTKKHE